MSIWLEQKPLILASQSAARRMLLANAGLSIECIPAEIDERGIQQSSGLRDPGKIAALLAAQKAKYVSAKFNDRHVVGADQTLALGEQLFSKPVNSAAAIEQIRILSGNVHELHSAVSVVKNGELLFSHVSVAHMTMRSLTNDQIAAYVKMASDAVTQSVGAYQLEAVGVNLFDRIDGDHFTILGLPLLPLLGFLRSKNLLAV
jgi:septum formation protein